jgi:hypothetical protein
VPQGEGLPLVGLRLEVSLRGPERVVFRGQLLPAAEQSLQPRDHHLAFRRLRSPFDLRQLSLAEEEPRMLPGGRRLESADRRGPGALVPDRLGASGKAKRREGAPEGG